MEVLNIIGNAVNRFRGFVSAVEARGSTSFETLYFTEQTLSTSCSALRDVLNIIIKAVHRFSSRSERLYIIFKFFMFEAL